MAGQRLVHGIIDHFGEQMMQRLFVRAADIHAGTATDRLESFQHLDVARGVSAFAGKSAGRSACRATRFREAGQQVGLFFARDALLAHYARARMKSMSALMWVMNRPKERHESTPLCHEETGPVSLTACLPMAPPAPARYQWRRSPAAFSHEPAALRRFSHRVRAH